MLVADVHPEYLSAKLATDSTNGKLALVEVQYHAHIASCMVENGVSLDAPPGLVFLMGWALMRMNVLGRYGFSTPITAAIGELPR